MQSMVCRLWQRFFRVVKAVGGGEGESGIGRKQKVVQRGILRGSYEGGREVFGGDYESAIFA